MKPTIISVCGLFKKEDIIELVSKMWEIQKRLNPKQDKSKYFMIWISNDEYNDEEVREILRKHFRDKDIAVIDIAEKEKRVAI